MTTTEHAARGPTHAARNVKIGVWSTTLCGLPGRRLHQRRATFTHQDGRELLIDNVAPTCKTCAQRVERMKPCR